jgi:hypothetical protein
MSYPRYELTWLAWSMGLMRQTTPAWREVYATVLKYASERYMEYHALNEWIEQRGPDPKRGSYPAAFDRLLPAGRRGSYDLPGWAANGREPYPYDANPLHAGGKFNLMYKGYMNYVHLMYRYVSGDARLDRGFTVRYDDAQQWSTSSRELNRLLEDQWRANHDGIACEVVKIYPWCNVLSRAGVALYDRMQGTMHANAARTWLDTMRRKFVDRDADGRPVNLIGYYDDDIQGGLVAPDMQSGPNWMVTTWCGLGLDASFFATMYDGAVRLLYRDIGDGRAFVCQGTHSSAPSDIATGLGAAIAAELGDATRAQALRAFIDHTYVPTWDRSRGEFFYTFGLDEPWPRGQLNAWVMPSRLVPMAGAWRQLFDGDMRCHSEPTLTGVDFPALRVRQAVYDRPAKVLSVAVAAGRPADAGRNTSVRVTQLAPNVRYRVQLDDSAVVQVADANGTLPITFRIGTHTLQVSPAS